MQCLKLLYEKSATITARCHRRLFIVGSEIPSLLYILKGKKIPTTKQPHGVRSPVASDVLLSALDSHHVAVDYRNYRTLAKGQSSRFFRQGRRSRGSTCSPYYISVGEQRSPYISQAIFCMYRTVKEHYSCLL